MVFHAPTVSFPVAGTVMIELQKVKFIRIRSFFCDAMISIRKEIMKLQKVDADNVLKNAPHTPEKWWPNDAWNFPYTREKAAFSINLCFWK